MDKFGIAVKCLIKNNLENYLILKKTNEEAKEDFSNNLYDLPGGRVEYGEEIQDAVIREVKEETVIEINGAELNILNAKSIIRKDTLHLVILLYFINININNVEINISNEHSDYYWVNERDYDKLPKWILDNINLINKSK